MKLTEIDKTFLKEVALIKQIEEQGGQVIVLKKRNCGRQYLVNLLNTEDINHEEVENKYNELLEVSKHIKLL